MKTHPTLPFGPLPEALWRDLARWAYVCENDEAAMCLLALTLNHGRDSDRQKVDAICRELRTHREFRRGLMQKEDCPHARACDQEQIDECDAFLAALRQVFPPRLTKAQRELLTAVLAAGSPGFCASGRTIRSLESSGFVAESGKCSEHTAPTWTITDAGRAALVAAR